MATLGAQCGLDDHTASFTVAAPTTRLGSLPDFARGYTQAADFENGGIPVVLDDANGVTSVSAEVLYDPELLTLLTAELGAGLPPDAVVDLDTTYPGRAVLTVSGPTPFSGTDVTLATLTAEVPWGAEYGSEHHLRLTSVLVDGPKPAATRPSTWRPSPATSIGTARTPGATRSRRPTWPTDSRPASPPSRESARASWPILMGTGWLA